MQQVKNTQIIQSKQMDQNFILKESERLNQVIENYSKGVTVFSRYLINNKCNS